jgi:hypothetical protein
MKAVIGYSSDWKGTKTRIEEVNSLEELLELQKKEVSPLIVTRGVDDKFKDKAEFTIEVYNDYRE